MAYCLRPPAREPLQNLSRCLHAFGRASFLLQYFHFMFLSFTPDSMESETVESMSDALRWWGIFQLAQVCDSWPTALSSGFHIAPTL